MLSIPTEPSTQVSQALVALSECSHNYITPTLNSTFKVKQNLFNPYISISGPSENIRLMYDMLKAKFGFGERIAGNSFPDKDAGNRLGFYLVGPTPFGKVYKGMGRSRLVFNYYDMEKETGLRNALSDMFSNPQTYFDDYLATVPAKEAYLARLRQDAQQTMFSSLSASR